VVQYLNWVGDILHGELGRSVLSQTSVTHEFRARFPVSFQLLLMTIIWVIGIGIPLGMISALRRNSPADLSARMLAILALSVPSFWVATLVLIIPVQLWGYAPPLGKQISFFSDPWNNLRQFGPASLVLALAPIASVMRLTRSTLLDVLRQDYIRTARAKGIREFVVMFRHALKNSLIPVVTVIGLLTAGLLGGALIIEQIFALRGIGQYLFMSILQKDFPVAQSLVMYTAAAVVLLNLLVDLSYAVLDPRIRYA
jgi:peptide/nickel transport system permease protein